MRLVVAARHDFPSLDALRRHAAGIEITVGESADELRGPARDADAVLLAPRYAAVLVELWRELERVRWIHTLDAGVDTLPFDLLRGSDAVVTNSRGLYADALGEFAVAAMLWFARDLRRLVRNQEARRWEPYTVQRLEGRTAGIIGYGGIGQAIGRRAAALGMRLLTLRRRQEFGDPSVDEVVAESDYLILSAPLTPATHQLLTRRRIEAMQQSAVLINVSRGRIVDEAALVEALAACRIRGAALDVFETEPLPADSPFWTLENVLLSPHSADHTADAHERAMSFYLENLARFRRGEPLENVVDKQAMY